MSNDKSKGQLRAGALAKVDEKLILALAHPYRVHALHILNQRVSTPKDLAAEVGCEVSTMAYHVKILRENGFVELVREEPRRGATAHFFRGTRRAILVDEEWVLVPEPIRAAIVGMQLRATGKLIGDSLASGTFERRSNRHHSLHEAVVDEEGWNEAMELLESTMEGIAEIERRSAERRHSDGDAAAPGVPLVISMIGFERAEAPTA